MQNKWWAKLLRVLGIVLMGLTAAFTILGGAGTTCVALNPTGYGEKFSPIATYQWLYILFVLVTLAIGVWGVQAVVRLSKGSMGAYRNALLVLISGLIVNGIHMFVSRQLRGSSMPVDMVFYTTLLTLIVFLIFRIPAVWQAVNFDRPRDPGKNNSTAAAIALVASGLLTLTIPFFMAPTHTVGGINYAAVWNVTLPLIGAGLLVAGLVKGIFQPHGFAAEDREVIARQ